MEDFIEKNGPGIDTQRERDQIQYRPKIQYEQPALNPNGYTYPTAPVVEAPFLAVETVEVWIKSEEIIDSIRDVEQILYDQLKDDYITIPTAKLTDAAQAAASYGVAVSNNGLPFDLYKKVILSENSLARDILKDIFDDYYLDVNGSIAGELYADIISIGQDWQSMQDFINSALLLQIVDSKNLPKAGTDNGSVLALVEAAEKALSDQYIAAKDLNDANFEDLRVAYMTSPDTSDYYDAEYAYEESAKILSSIERKLYTKKEVVDLVQYKAANTESLVASINNFSSYEPYDSEISSTLYSILSPYITRQSAENGLRKVQALLRLSIDGKINTVQNTKTDLDGIASNRNKVNVNTSLTQGVHLRNEVYNSVHDLLDSIDAPKDSTFEMVGAYIMDSVAETDNIYAEQSGDFHKIHYMDSELYRQKLSQVVDKDGARQLYQIIESLISYGKEKGWPNNSQLSSWVEEFVKYKGL
jgi:hypothetical protein